MRFRSTAAILVITLACAADQIRASWNPQSSRHTTCSAELERLQDCDRLAQAKRNQTLAIAPVWELTQPGYLAQEFESSEAPQGSRRAASASFFGTGAMPAVFKPFARRLVVGANFVLAMQTVANSAYADLRLWGKGPGNNLEIMGGITGRTWLPGSQHIQIRTWHKRRVQLAGRSCKTNRHLAEKWHRPSLPGSGSAKETKNWRRR